MEASDSYFVKARRQIGDSEYGSAARKTKDGWWGGRDKVLKETD